MGIVAVTGFALICLVASQPSSSGRLRSIRIRSGTSLCARNTGHAIGSLNYFIPFTPQNPGYQFLVCFIVFNDQYSCHRVIRSRKTFECTVGFQIIVPFPRCVY